MVESKYYFRQNRLGQFLKLILSSMVSKAVKERHRDFAVKKF
jgi:hypothetical protein